MNLRDHDRQCEHTKWARRNKEDDWVCLFGFAGGLSGRCPGGAAVAIDYEAARQELIAEANEIEGTGRHSIEAVRDIVDTALGLTDD